MAEHGFRKAGVEGSSPSAGSIPAPAAADRLRTPTGPEPEVGDIEQWFDRHGVRPKIGELPRALNDHVKSLDEGCLCRIGKAAVIPHCPERAFLYVSASRARLSTALFTHGEPPGRTRQYSSEQGPVLVGGLPIDNADELQTASPLVAESYTRINAAIANREPSGRHARLEAEDAEDGADSGEGE